MSFAAVLAAMPDLLARALAEHVPDEYARCRECRSDDGTGAAWPCAMRLLAEQASGMSAPIREQAPVTAPTPVQSPVSERWDPLADRRAFRRDRYYP